MYSRFAYNEKIGRALEVKKYKNMRLYFRFYKLDKLIYFILKISTDIK